MEVEWLKIAVCDNDPKAVEIFGRYAAAVIEYAFTYEFYQNPEEMLAAYAGQEQGFQSADRVPNQFYQIYAGCV